MHMHIITNIIEIQHQLCNSFQLDYRRRLLRRSAHVDRDGGGRV